MGHNAKPVQEEEGGESAPLWMISFADMMSLLMAFFVMLSTFSDFGPSEADKLQSVVDATLAPDCFGGTHETVPRTAMGPQMPAAGQLDKGSEKPTLEEGQGNGLMQETSAGDFRTRKIFLMESTTAFWGAGTALSVSGREFLNTLAAFVATMPDRIVISESGPGDDPEQGLRRAAGVLSYLAAQGVDKDRCSIAVQAMSPDPSLRTQRMLEIALLNASVYQ